MPKRSFYIKDSELDDYQLTIINKRRDNSFIVMGYDGSRIDMALWKAKQIENENSGSYCIIVLTKTLKQYMSGGMKQIGLNDNNIDYLWNWERKGCPLVDFIIVYEAQEFTKEEILRFRDRAKKALFLFGEPTPSSIFCPTINGRTTVSMEEIAGITRFPVEHLCFNYSLPKKIARVAQYIYNANDDIEARCKNEGIEKPYVLKYNSLEEQLDATIKIIKDRKFEDVAILFKSNYKLEQAYYYLSKKITVEANIRIEYPINPYLSWHSEETEQYLKSIGTSITDIPAHDLYIQLPEKKYEGIKYLRTSFDAQQKIIIEEKRRNIKEIDFNTNNPKLLTYYSSKGLHFEAVFLPECTDSGERNSLYIAMTRTYQSLYIMYSGKSLSLFDIVPTNLYETNLITNVQ